MSEYNRAKECYRILNNSDISLKWILVLVEKLSNVVCTFSFIWETKMDTCLGVAVLPFIICRDLPLILSGASLGFLFSRRFKAEFQWGIEKRQHGVLLLFGWRWMGKGPFVSSSLSAPEPLQACSPHRGRGLQGEHEASGRAVERQLCGKKHTGTGCPQDQEKATTYTLHNREPWRHTFFPKTIHPGVLLAWRSSLLLRTGCAPKVERHTAVCAGKPPPFCPFWSHKSHLDKAESECMRTYFWRNPQYGSWRHLTRGGMSLLSSLSRTLSTQGSAAAAASSQMEQQRNFFFSSVNYTPLLWQYRV